MKANEYIDKLPNDTIFTNFKDKIKNDLNYQFKSTEAEISDDLEDKDSPQIDEYENKSKDQKQEKDDNNLYIKNKYQFIFI